jgi:hypothetical protein
MGGVKSLVYGIGMVAIMLFSASGQAFAHAADTMFLTDEPGNWFRSEANGIPLSIVKVGDEVKFRVDGDETDTIHTATLLLAPPGSTASLDQEKPFKGGGASIVFDVEGVYLFICKVHPYMTGAVAVLEEFGPNPLEEALALSVPVDELPFIQHLGLGVDSLPLSVVATVLTVIAPADDLTVLGTQLGKLQKWDIFSSSDDFLPAVAGVGEVWVDSQFERVNGQRKPGTITVVNVGDTDGTPFTIEREVDGQGVFEWNNPHNMWANFEFDVIYNSNWFGKWVNKIDRATGTILDSVEVGFSPTHIITNPNPDSDEFGFLHIPISAGDDIVRVEDQGNRLHVEASNPSGAGRNHPHGHWLQCGTGARTVVPNVFKGLGFAGSISVIDSENGDVIKEFLFDPDDDLQSTLLMPIAAGECHVDGISKAYVGNVVTGTVTVIDLGDAHYPAENPTITKNICVTLLPGTTQAQIDGLVSGPGEGNGCNVGQFAGPAVPLFHTLQLPIQTPVSADGKWVATAVFSLVNIDRTLGLERSAVGTDDHVAIIDTSTDKVVAFLPTPAGTHGINWGAKKGGGYYAYVTAQHANVLTVIDPDPDDDVTTNDAAVVGQIALANGTAGAGPTDGTGGQGVKPLPMAHDGWIQPAVALVGTGKLSAEVEGWISSLTAQQKNPDN